MNERLEIKFAKIHNQRYAVTANSGTSTLHMALNAFGVGHGDEVIIPGLTVAMCGYAVWQCGAVPVYADVKKDTFLIDPLDIEKKNNKKNKSYYGRSSIRINVRHDRNHENSKKK